MQKGISDVRRSNQNAKRNAKRSDSTTSSDGVEAERYGPEHVMKLYMPVAICMVWTALSVTFVEYYRNLKYRDETKSKFGFLMIYTKGATTTEKLSDASGNVVNLVAMLASMTFVVLILFKLKAIKVLYTWSVLSTVLLLTLFFGIYLHRIVCSLHIAVDYFSFGFVVWNVAGVGSVAMFGSAPLVFQQFFLIVTSVLLAHHFIEMVPVVTLWIVLLAVVIWDIFAVLSPQGPLRLLSEGETNDFNTDLFPALVYTSGLVNLPAPEDDTLHGKDRASKDDVIDDEDHDEGRSHTPDGSVLGDGCTTRAGLRKRRPSTNLPEEVGKAVQNENTNAAAEEPGKNSAKKCSREMPPNEGNSDDVVRLGAGDFVFYSTLTGLATIYGGILSAIGVFVGVLVGLCLTLVILAFSDKAMPALPMPLLLGLLFHFAGVAFLAPFTKQLGNKQVFL